METQIKSALDAHGKAIDEAMQKYDGQLAANGKASEEAKQEVKALSEKFEKAITEIAQKMEKQDSGAMEILTAGDEFIKSEQFKQLVARNSQMARLEVKNTVTSVNGNTTYPMQNAGIVPGNFLPLTVRSLFSAIPVTTNMVTSMRELAWTNSAAEVSQGASKPESAVTFEQYNVPITTVAHWIKISNQLLADAPAVVAYINTRLRDGLAQRIDLQLLKGNGTSPNLSGLTDTGNFTAYTPSSDDLLIDAINRAKYSLWATGNVPDAVIVNPADWGALERAKETGGQYLYGAPGVAAGMNPFGCRVVLSNNVDPGKFIIGALNSSSSLYVREGATIEMGYVNEDFTKNLITIRAEERLGLGVDRPAGILYGSFTA